MKQLAVAFSKEDAQIQNLGNVEQEVVVDDLSKHSRGEEVILWQED